MLPKRDPNSRVIMPGLPADLAESLGHTVHETGTIFYLPQLFPLLRGLGLIRGTDPDLVFVWTGENAGAFVLEAMTRAEPQVPAPSVYSPVKSQEILDAFGTGAVGDYVPPFDFIQIAGLLQATVLTPCC